MTRIRGISASPRAGSFNGAWLRAAQDVAGKRALRRDAERDAVS